MRSHNGEYAVGKMHFEAVFGRLPVGGFATISMLTNGRAFASYQFTSDGAQIRWSSFALILGAKQGKVRNRKFEGTTVNYLRDNGLRIGHRTPLEIEVQVSKGVTISQLRVFPDSYLGFTTRPPFPISVKIGRVEKAIVGQPFRIFLRMRLLGMEQDSSVVRLAAFPKVGLLRVVSPPMKLVVGGRRPIEASVRIMPKAAGSDTVDILVSTGGASRAVEVHVNSVVAGSEARATLRKAVGIALGIGGLGLAAMAFRRGRGRTFG